MRWWVAAAVICGLLGVVGVADSTVGYSVAPTHQEREAIVQGLPASVRNTPVGCLNLNIRISSDSRYGRVDLEYLNARRGTPCLRYASNGFFLLKKGRRWKVVYNGSDPAPCRLRVPRDLGRCLRG